MRESEAHSGRFLRGGEADARGNERASDERPIHAVEAAWQLRRWRLRMTIVDAAVAAAQAFYLLSPLLASSALSGLVLRFDLVRVLKRPIDGGRGFRGHRIFGDGKTWRGVVVAVTGCIATVAVQKYLLRPPHWLVVVAYERIDVIVFGAAMGVGAMVGELPNSFVKRRLGISPGASARGLPSVVFYVWDQIDLLTTLWPILFLWVRPRVLVIAMSFALVMTLHPAVSLIGYLIGARRSAR